MRRFCSLLVLCSCLVSAAGFAQDPKVPTTITSDTMFYHPDKKEVSFVGDVHVVREEFKLWAEKLIIYFSKDQAVVSSRSKNQNGTQGQDLSNVETIVALNNVRLESQGKKGFCGKATYFQKTEMVQMEDNPRLEDGRNTISGEIIKLYVRDNRSEIVGGKKRVQAIFFSRPQQMK